MEMHVLKSPFNPQRTQELDRLGDEIAELSAHLDAATARLLDLIRQFDARGGWNTGFRSCAAWLSWRVGLDLGAARERVRVARALGTLPRLAEALARGSLSYAKVRALTRVATPETEERLLAVGRAGTAAHVERIVRGWRRVDRAAEAREAARQHVRRGLRVFEDEDGMVVVRGRLAPEVGALLRRALEAAPRGAVPAGAREVRWAQAEATAEPPDSGSAASRRAGAGGGDRAAPGPRPRHAGRALPGRGPRRCAGAGGPGPAGAVGPGGRRARFRGNVPTPGVRRQPGGACGMTARAGWWRSGRGRGRSRRRSGGRCSSGTGAAASRGAVYVSPRAIISATGRRAAPRPFPTWPCSVGGIIARSTRRATRWSGSRTVGCDSGARMAGNCPRCRRRPQCLGIRWKRSGRAMRLRDSPFNARTGLSTWLGEPLDLVWAIDVLHPLARRAPPRPCPGRPNLT